MTFHVIGTTNSASIQHHHNDLCYFQVFFPGKTCPERALLLNWSLQSVTALKSNFVS